MQSARYLIKNLLATRAGKQPQGSAAYLGNAKGEMRMRCSVQDATEWRDPKVQLAAFR